MIKDIHFRPSERFLPRVERQRHVSRPIPPALLDRLETVGRLAPPPPEPSLVSSVFDTFDRLLFTLPEEVFTHRAYGKVFKDLFRKLPDRVQFVFVAKERNHPTLKAWVRELNLRVDSIVTAPDDLEFTVWAEDAYAAVQTNGEGRSYLVEPKRFRRDSDNFIANIVTAQSDIGLSYARNLIFQGGNILVGDSFWMIGEDYVNQSRPFTNDPQMEFRRALECRRNPIVIGSRIHIPLWKVETLRIEGRNWRQERFRGNFRGTRQPIFHIDMFITLAGRNRRGRPIVLVGDPRLGSQLMGEVVNPDSLPDVFDDIAAQLASRPERFVVIRTPLPLIAGRNPRKRTILWYFATSNNALVQVEGNRKEVWLPTYGHGEWEVMKAVDNYHVRVWRSLGFQVHRLEDFHPFAIQLGAAHCIKKYLNR